MFASSLSTMVFSSEATIKAYCHTHHIHCSFEMDGTGDTILHKLAKMDCISSPPRWHPLGILNFLVAECSVDINKQNALGQTPLHCAILAKQELFVMCLLAYKANLQITDYSGKTPLDLACIYPDVVNTELFEIMLGESMYVSGSDSLQAYWFS